MNSPRLRHNLVPAAGLPLTPKRDTMSDQLKFDVVLFGAAIVASAAVLGANLDLQHVLRLMAGLL